jgi:hypothetical protein
VNQAQAHDIARYLATGKHDELGAVWSGNTIVEAMRNARTARRRALCRAVDQRALRGTIALPALGEEPRTLVRARVAPMVRGLFPAGEREIVLALLEHSLASSRR